MTAEASGGPGNQLAERILDVLRAGGQTVAVAESLTGGLLAAALTDVPGASAAFRGGVVAYATEIKAALLGVPQPLLGQYGAVHPDVAVAMADGARSRLGASLGVGTTGVAGPEAAEGKPVGTVHIAVAAQGSHLVRSMLLSGDRAAIRRVTVARALGLLLSWLEDSDQGAERTREDLH